MAKNNKMPAIRFSGYTDAWEQCKLGELAEIVRGASPRPISDPKWFDNNSNVGWLRIADVTAQDGRIQYLEQKISELGQEKTRVIKTPHLLLSIAATVGKPVINYVPTGVHDGFLIFLNPKFNILYTFWWLEMFREKWSKYGQPGSQVNLNSDLVKSQVINIPNEKEQEKISSFLESLDKIITLHQRKLGKLKLTKKALLQKLFPKNGSKFPELRFQGFTDAWEQRKLGEVVKSYSGGTPTASNKEYYGGDIPFIRSAEINSDTTELYITQKGLDNSSAKIVEKGTILYAMYGATSGEVGISKINGAINQAILAMIPLEYNGKIIAQYLRKNKESIIGKYLQGGQGNLSANIILELPIQLPGLEESNQIANFLESFDNIITLHQRKLDMLKNVKKCLLQKMFV